MPKVIDSQHTQTSHQLQQVLSRGLSDGGWASMPRPACCPRRAKLLVKPEEVAELVGVAAAVGWR